MMQFNAMLVDAYRELNSRKLFWIVLLISTLVMLFYASISFNETGMSMFFGLWNIESEFIQADTPIARMLYRSIFSSFIVGIWLAWAAVILALISTTTIFPDFIASGAIDLSLSKPIGRLRLFIYKYVLSLLFVVLQVSIFCVGVFLCIGWRMGEWNWMIFSAIPLITLFFSYLYSLNVLVGVVTRSALTALLVTMLLWAGIFSINMSEGIILQIQTSQELQIEQSELNRDRLNNALTQLDADEDADRRTSMAAEMQREQQTIDTTRETLAKLDPWMGRVQAIKYVLPKTGETVGLLERWLQRDTDVSMTDIMSGNITMNEDGEYVPAQNSRERRAQQRIMDFYASRSLWYIIGTSLIFELVMLCLAAWIFCRREY